MKNGVEILKYARTGTFLDLLYYPFLTFLDPFARINTLAPKLTIKHLFGCVHTIHLCVVDVQYGNRCVIAYVKYKILVICAF